jgi:hypothetical protein
VWEETCKRWNPAVSAELFEFDPQVLAENRHEREDEVGLVELYTLAVDSDENFRHKLLVDNRRDLQRGKWVRL